MRSFSGKLIDIAPESLTKPHIPITDNKCPLATWQHWAVVPNTLSSTCGVLVHSFPGFCRLRMHNKGGSPVAFMEYQDVRYAAQVMAALQGSFLLSSDRGPIRIEYAKSKMAAEVGLLCLCLRMCQSFFFSVLSSIVCVLILLLALFTNDYEMYNCGRGEWTETERKKPLYVPEWCFWNR